MSTRPGGTIGGSAAAWFLTAAERRNSATRLDARHPAAGAWTTGNLATPLVHGATYFAELLHCVGELQRDDLLLFTDWRGDPDERLSDQPDSAVSQAFCAAARRGVIVRGLVWRSHLDKLSFSAAENRHLGEDIERAGGLCLLDMRVRTGGSHHQKFVVLRHPGNPALDVAFVGGIDLCHCRRDDAAHLGDPQPQPMATVYGPRPPWHDVMLALHGPVVGDVEAVFRERWEDPQPLTRNPLHWLADRVHGQQRRAPELPSQLPDPSPVGTHSIQLLRTYPRRLGGYPFAPEGERSVALGYTKALRRARCLVYVEDQYLWSREIASIFAEALRTQPGLHVIAVLPHHPDQDGRFSLPPNLVGRHRAISIMREAGGDRVAVYGVENAHGTPVYVHAKVCVIDDTWATVGSDNLNRRSWTHDSELSAAVLDDSRDTRTPLDPAGLGDGARRFARNLRLQLMREHLGHSTDDNLLDPHAAFLQMQASAAVLDAWHTNPGSGPRPRGQLRPLVDPPLPPGTTRWATIAYHRVYDPDGRPRVLRRHQTF
ncbi:MAG: phospholipase D-like domain-containing protein [Actinomycetota bacterium]|nr:phospholipase D-like domain-containing protein [Actinomycetota bacterium]